MIIFPKLTQYCSADRFVYSDKNSIPFSTSIFCSYSADKFSFFSRDASDAIYVEAEKIFRQRDIFNIMNSQEEIARELEENVNKQIPQAIFKDFTITYFQDAQDSTLIKEYRDGLKVGYTLKGIQDGSGVDPDKLAEQVATIMAKQVSE